MTFVPPVGADMLAAPSTQPVSAETSLPDSKMQTLFDNMSYAELRGEMLGDLPLINSNTSIALRNVLERVKQDSVKTQKVLTEGLPRIGLERGNFDQNSVSLHRGPAVDSFERPATLQETPSENEDLSNLSDEIVKNTINGLEFAFKMKFVATLTSSVLTSVNHLIKGQ